MGLLGSLFKREKLQEPLDLSVLKADMHSHLIPAIDDGAKSVDHALELIRGLAEKGYKKLITTPHVMSDFYRNSSDEIRRGEELMIREISNAGIQIGFQAAAEYYLDDHFEALIEKKDLLTFGDNYVLFELPFAQAPSSLKRVIFNLQMAGYKPILAHPERYVYWHNDFSKFQTLAETDVYLQVNINSLSGVYSPQVKKAAVRMLEENLVSFIGTDTHHEGHVLSLTESSRIPALHRAVEAGQIKNAEL